MSIGMHMGCSLSRLHYDAVIFDLDGVVSQSSDLHARAWEKMFNDYLTERGRQFNQYFQPFSQRDYKVHVDGKLRYEGVKNLLKSREIELPYGSPQDSSQQETVCGLGNRKNEIFQEFIAIEPVPIYASTVEFINKLRKENFKIALISSSKNCQMILDKSGIAHLFDTRVDGIICEKENLRSKPQPDIFLKAANNLEVKPERTVVIEDSLSGVEAAVNGSFGLVIGINRDGNTVDLQKHGADLVVNDLKELQLNTIQSMPSALDNVDKICDKIKDKHLFIFLDYDGTLTPIVANPQDAILSTEVRSTIHALSKKYQVAVISGRDLRDLRQRVAIDDIYYAGSHGFDICGPNGLRMNLPEAETLITELDKVQQALQAEVLKIKGSQVERKRFGVTVHFRNVPTEQHAFLKQIVKRIVENYQDVKLTLGKMVIDLRPNLDWNKGKAVLWLLDKIGLENQAKFFSIYLGDDLTDEDAFHVLDKKGLGILVRDKETNLETAADYALDSPAEVLIFLKKLLDLK